MPTVALWRRPIIVTTVLLATSTIHRMCNSVNKCHSSSYTWYFSTLRGPLPCGPLRSEATDGGRFTSALRGPSRVDLLVFQETSGLSEDGVIHSWQVVVIVDGIIIIYLWTSGNGTCRRVVKRSLMSRMAVWRSWTSRYSLVQDFHSVSIETFSTIAFIFDEQVSDSWLNMASIIIENSSRDQRINNMVVHD